MSIKRRVSVSDFMMMFVSITFFFAAISLFFDDEITMGSIIVSIGVILSTGFGLLLYGDAILLGLRKVETLHLLEDHLEVYQFFKKKRLNYVDIVNMKQINSSRNHSANIEIHFIDQNQRERILRIYDHYEYKIDDLVQLIEDATSRFSPSQEYGEQEYKNIIRKFDQIKDENIVFGLLVSFFMFMGVLLGFIGYEVASVTVGPYFLVLGLDSVAMILAQQLYSKEKITYKVRNIILSCTVLLVFLNYIYIIVLIIK